MPISLSRRHWFVGVAIATLGTSAVAEPPAERSGSPVRISGSVSMPIQSRTIRLKNELDQPLVVTAIAADPTGEFLAVAGDDHIIRVLRTANLSIAETLQGHRDLIRTLAFDPRGKRMVSAGNDGQLILWDCSDSFSVTQRMKGTPALARVRFSPDGSEMAAVGFDNEVFLIGRSSDRRPNFTCDCHDLRAVAYREDNRVLAVAGRSGDLHLFDLNSDRMVGDYHLHGGRIHDLVFHRQSNTLIGVGEDGHVSVFDTEKRKLRHDLPVTTGKLFTAALLNSQLVAVAGSDNVIRIVNTDEGRVVRSLEGHQGSVSTLTANSEFLFSGGYDATLRRWPINAIDSGQQRIAGKEPSVDR